MKQPAYSVGVAENVNKRYRPSMEDVHTYVENFGERLGWGYFAVFDGHAGQAAARWCGQHLHSVIGERLVKDEQRDVREVLNECFLLADEEIVNTLQGSSGCTAAVAVVRWEVPESEESQPVQSAQVEGVSEQQAHRVLYTANVGDSRVVLCRGSRAVRLTYDHKASDRLEIRRIEARGGLIMKNRVNGMLAVTRSLGDQFFKDLVIGNPYTTRVELDTQDEFLIVACDGLWDVMTDQKACELIRGEKDASKAAQMLVDAAMAKHTTDNVTVMVVRLG